MLRSDRQNLSNEGDVKQLLSALPLPEHLQIGAAVSRGDCFFDAIAQGLNQLQDSSAHTVKSLRTVCDTYIKALNGQHRLVKELMNEECGQSGYMDYIARLPYTADEMDEHERNRTLMGTATWGRAHIEGQIIAAFYSVNLHVIEVREAEESLDGVFVTEQWVTENKAVNIELLPAEGYLQPNVLHLVVHRGHFVPLLSTPENTLQLDSLPLSESNGSANASAESQADKEDSNDDQFAQAVEMELSRPVLNEFHCPADYPTSLQLALKTLHGQLAGHIPSNISLYPHQTDALIQHVNFLMAGGQADRDQRHVVYPWATGAGKSVAFAFLVSALANKQHGSRKTLIVVPRINLKDQITATLATYASHLSVSSDTQQSAYVDVTITTYQALKAKLRDINKHQTRVLNASNELAKFLGLFGDFIIDEAHYACAQGGVELVNEMMRAAKQRKVTISAFTATHTYNLKSATKNKDEVLAEKSVFAVLKINKEENPITPFTMREAITAGVLAPVKGAVLTPVLDEKTKQVLASFSGGNNSTTDIQENKVGRAIDKEPFNRLIVDTYANAIDPDNHQRLLGKQGVVFCAGVNHAENIADLLNACIPLDHPLVQQAREAYVEKKRQSAAPHFFDEAGTRAAFAVAKAIHAGAYRVWIDSDKMPDILAKGWFTYERNGNTIKYSLKARDREKLNKNQSKEGGCAIPVSKLLTDAEKEKILSDYKDGCYLILPGADMLTAGFDHWNTDVVIHARPTKSEVMIIQSCGRAVRKRQDINPNKIAYIISINWGIKGQLLYPICLDNQMRLGQFPALALAADMPLIDIANKSQSNPLAWEQCDYLHLAPAPAGTKRAIAKALQADIKRQRHEAASLEESVQKLQERLQCLEPTITQLSTLIKREHIPVVTQAVSQAIVSGVKNPSIKKVPSQLSNHMSEAEPDIAQTAIPFTRQARTNVHALQQYADKITRELEDILAAVKEVASDEAVPTVKHPRQQTGAASSSDSPPHQWHTHNTLDNPIQELTKALHKLSTLQTQLKQLIGGPLTAQSASASSPHTTVLEKKDMGDILAQCEMITQELEVLPQYIQVNAIVDHVNQARLEKKQAQASAINAAATFFVPPPPPVPGVPGFVSAHVQQYYTTPPPPHVLGIFPPPPTSASQSITYAELKDLKSKIHHASSTGKSDDFVKLIERLPDINCPLLPTGGSTALHTAAAAGQVFMVNCLLNHPAILVNSITYNKDTALHCAARAGCLGVVDLLVEYRANINSMNRFKDTPLHLAVRGHTNKHVEVVRKLLACGADVSKVDSSGLTPLMVAKNLRQASNNNTPGRVIKSKLIQLLENAETQLKFIAPRSTAAAPAVDVHSSEPPMDSNNLPPDAPVIVEAIRSGDLLACQTLIPRLPDINCELTIKKSSALLLATEFNKLDIVA